MSHQLDFIKRESILKAIQQIDKESVPKDNEWSEYWINYENKLYQFKYVVQIASSFTQTQLKLTDFTSNDSSRNYIASLGFHILFKSHKVKNIDTNYWVGARNFSFGTDKLTNMLGDFMKKKYWSTNHNLENGVGLKIYNKLTKVKVNDRICVRFLDIKGGNINIEAVGTVSDTTEIKDGKLNINWDYNPPLYKGQKPSGSGAGNWRDTFFQLHKHSDIELIFGETLIEKRLARLAWNDYGWVMPSGSYGKSEHKDTHEAQFGYGHEEWLFDSSKLIDGFHYSFLEPIRKEQNAYTGKIYKVWLYSMNGLIKKRYWIGEIDNLIVINRDEAERVKQTYIKNGWLQEMEEQIMSAGANEKGFSNWKGIDLFNVKFMMSDVLLNDPYFELPETHPIYSQSRYTFVHFNDDYKVLNENIENDFIFLPNDNIDEKDPKTKIHFREAKAIEIVYLHRKISILLTKYLKNIHGRENVSREHASGYGANKIDIVVKQDKIIFYEIKTYNSLKTSIREAFGQLLEYCFYPDKRKAEELIVVSHLPADEPTKIYFHHLRSTFKIPIYYQSFNLELELLSEKC